MRLTVRVPVAILTAIVLGASPTVAQSLSKVAKDEEARRNGVRAPSRTFTNADLTADPKDSGPTTTGDVKPASPPPTVAVASPPAPGNASGPAAMPAPPKPELNEGFWRRRAAELRASIAKAQQDVKALSGANHADAREQARVEALLTKLQGMLSRAEDAHRLFEMQADVAKVPKAWIQ